jgi:hypothetical protein
MIAEQSKEELTGRQVISAYGVIAYQLIIDGVLSHQPG